MYGELVPFGGGDPIPLVKPQVAGRAAGELRYRAALRQCLGTPLREIHAGERLLVHSRPEQPQRHEGQRSWVTAKKRLDPGDRLAIAKRTYEVRYSPAELGAWGPPPDETALGEILGQSLMKSTGWNAGSTRNRKRSDNARSSSCPASGIDAQDQRRFPGGRLKGPAPGLSSSGQRGRNQQSAAVRIPDAAR